MRKESFVSHCAILLIPVLILLLFTPVVRKHRCVQLVGFIVIASQQIITVFVVKFAGGVTFCDFICFCNAFPLGVNLGKTLSYLIEHVA
jgi:hypothetical protein